jgi:hypothetical protein
MFFILHHEGIKGYEEIILGHGRTSTNLNSLMFFLFWTMKVLRDMKIWCWVELHLS